MEIFIIIPILAVIFGWMQSFPKHQAQPTGCNGFCNDYVGSESLISSQGDDDTFSTGMSFDDNYILGIGISMSGDIFSDGNGIDAPDIMHEMMFNPAYEWNSFNIYHHDDISHDMGMNDTFSDPFCNGFDDITSIHSFD